ncbi:metalloregulator ArsR/SmtB family transcription factor [Kineosporia sp. NBRC 101731]|uniref:ArsR/SmtB family transcription factor n=1 Tax=Kineosporia sp. NBRC 101731 TaxID=3032199 RepID=UPI0024A27AF0|nr:metalloregulator ArsR/SmtB family transcription factor [Kineosporia sp. NBRC 101731]GLY29133.1 putative transcriptional regulator, ArsR family protein [Kineosporia sp. NBRC 101731]
MASARLNLDTRGSDAPSGTGGATCCSSVATGPIRTAEEAERLAGLLKALAEPTRLRLLSLVAAHAGGEACVCDLTGPVGLSQPTVSHHLKILVDAGLLTREKRGVWAYYTLVPERMQQIAQALDFTR